MPLLVTLQLCRWVGTYVSARAWVGGRLSAGTSMARPGGGWGYASLGVDGRAWADVRSHSFVRE
eukprot:807328-Pleurochrysis_carterae.AAC.1